MKRFIISVLCISVFFIGLGAIVDNVGAAFKSDEKALALIKQSRIAIGGDQAIAEIRGLVIIGKTTHNFNIDGVAKSEQGETEIALQLPDKLMKMVRMGNAGDAAHGDKTMRHDLEVIVAGDGAHDVTLERKHGELAAADGSKVRIKRLEGAEAKAILEGKDGEFVTEDGNKVFVRKTEAGEGGEHRVFVRKGEGDLTEFRAEGGEKRVLHDKIRTAHGKMRDNELLRTTLGLLLSAPEGMDVTYTFAGEGDVDGVGVNIVNADFAGSYVRLYLSKASSLPVAIGYLGHPMPKVVHFRQAAPSSDAAKDTVTFARKLEGPAETAEFMIKFSDYRSAGGVQLPYKWTTTVAGRSDEVFDVTSYDVNPANLIEKFGNQKVMIRSKKPAGQ